MLEFSNFKLSKTEFHSDLFYSIYLQKDYSVNFIPGQFYMIKSSSFPDKLPRSYSVSSGTQDEFLRFSIKITGEFTKALSELKPGFELELFGPMGKFTIKPESKKVLLVAGGIGVAPFLSMLKENLQDKNKQLLLLYSCKTKEESVFTKELEDLNFEDSSSSNTFIPFYSREGSRVNEEILSNYLDFDEYMTCGPDALMKFCTNYWNSKEIPKTKIRIESFGLPSKKI